MRRPCQVPHSYSLFADGTKSLFEAPFCRQSQRTRETRENEKMGKNGWVLSGQGDYFRMCAIFSPFYPRPKGLSSGLVMQTRKKEEREREKYGSDSTARQPLTDYYVNQCEPIYYFVLISNPPRGQRIGRDVLVQPVVHHAKHRARMEPGPSWSSLGVRAYYRSRQGRASRVNLTSRPLFRFPWPIGSYTRLGQVRHRRHQRRLRVEPRCVRESKLHGRCFQNHL